MSDTPNTSPGADLPDTLPPILEKLTSYRHELAQKEAKCADLTEQIEHQEKAALAAEAESDAAKRKLREALRASIGRPTKKMYELKAEEKSALSLAEEYRALAYDIGIERDRVVVDRHVVANNYRDTLKAARTILADHLLDRALAGVPRELVEALRLQAGLQEHDPHSEWHQIPVSDSATAFEFVFARACKRLLALLKDAPDNRQAMLPAELATPLNTAGLVASPLELKRMRDDLAERERAGYPLEA
ncbi:MAG: hypothetical protein Q8O33_07110 [Pseudomonadota bacterium]|nr:hypothetical protein [Pseudomonadota bacterium]